MEKMVTAVAYETIEDTNGELSLLRPMSGVASRMLIQIGAHCLEKTQGGRGVMLSGLPGVQRERVIIIGPE